MTECVPNHTSLNYTKANTCFCKGGYYGTYCENYNELFYPFSLFTKIYQTIIFAINLFCFVVRVIDLYKTKKLVANLSLCALILNFLANCIVVSNIWVSWGTVQLSESELYIILIPAIILAYSPTILWMASTSLIAGFWYEVLTKNMQDKFPKRTKILVITFSVIICICAIVGMCVILANFQYYGIGFALIFGPLIIDIVVTTIVSAKVVNVSINDLSGLNKEKKRWVSSFLIAISVVWILCIIAIGLSLVFTYSVGAKYGVIASTLFAVCEGVISILLMMLLDHHIKSVRNLVLAKAFPDVAMPATITTRTRTIKSSADSTPRTPSTDSVTVDHTSSV